MDHAFVISLQKVRDTIKKREEMQMKLKQDFDESVKSISTQIESHGKKLMNKIMLKVNKRVNSLVDYMKEFGEKELNSFNEVTDTFKTLLNAHEQSHDTKKNDINFYNRDLLIQFLSEKFEINLEFVPSKYFAPYDLCNFGHFEIDGNICSDLKQSKGEADEAQHVDAMIADVEPVREPSLKRRRVDDEQMDQDQCKHDVSESVLVSKESVSETADDHSVLQQIHPQMIGQIKVPSQLRTTSNDESKPNSIETKLYEEPIVESALFDEPELDFLINTAQSSTTLPANITVTVPSDITPTHQHEYLAAPVNGPERRKSVRLDKEKEKEKDNDREKKSGVVHQINVVHMIMDDIRKLSQGPITVDEFVDGIYQRMTAHLGVQDPYEQLELKKQIVDTLRCIQPDFDYGSLLKKMSGKTPTKVNPATNSSSGHEKTISQIQESDTYMRMDDYIAMSEDESMGDNFDDEDDDFTLECNEEDDERTGDKSSAANSNMSQNGEDASSMKCAICKMKDHRLRRHESYFVVCGFCDRSFHNLCYVPNITIKPKDKWRCGLCLTPERFLSLLNEPSMPSLMNPLKANLRKSICQSGIQGNDLKCCEHILLNLYSKPESMIFHKVKNYVKKRVSFCKSEHKSVSLFLIKTKLSTKSGYKSIDEFVSDVFWIIINSSSLSKSVTDVENAADQLKQNFMQLMKLYMPKYDLSSYLKQINQTQ